MRLQVSIKTKQHRSEVVAMQYPSIHDAGTTGNSFRFP